MSMTKYGKYESNRLWSIKCVRWTMVDEVNGMNYDRWNERDGLRYVNTTKIKWWEDNVTT